MQKELSVLESIKRLRGLSNGAVGSELEALTTKNLLVVEAHKGFLLCNLIIPNTVADRDGNWHVGAIATLIDNVGSAAIYSDTASVPVSVDFSISFYSTAKVQEEVELKATVVGKKEKLTSVVVEISKTRNGELIAVGKQWMASTNSNAYHASKL
ncbi:hypothetical protein L6164_021523 [Bauhinia variegata]|uniref:Uncharacterized protein n=1 Tax=Bauhinia variegata TaxID=167791 RepID=A0ACB9N2J9_BAUVA|nr:hypothetical protein L6164_021523 [Bauhinia variegata]